MPWQDRLQSIQAELGGRGEIKCLFLFDEPTSLQCSHKSDVVYSQACLFARF